MIRTLFAVVIALVASGLALGADTTLSNGTIDVTLTANKDATPHIANIAWTNEKSPIAESNTDLTLDQNLPNGFTPAANADWHSVQNPNVTRAEARLALDNGLTATWIVELLPHASTLRMHIRLENPTQKPCAIPWYPIWAESWSIPGRSDTIRWWKALSFSPTEQAVATSTDLKLFSHVHSSDDIDGGVNPYWRLAGKDGHVYFSLDWCGGWQANFSGSNVGFNFRVLLPEDETQLILAPGETIDGPVLNITIPRIRDERFARADWMRQRAELARILYGGPSPTFPLTWNHWYADRFKVDAPFLRRQVDALSAYTFDYFIVDAGWFQACGNWVPDPRKFNPGEFESILADVRKHGPKVGLWSCPQFVHADATKLPSEVDRPGYYIKHKSIEGYLLDYTAMNFSQYLVDHVEKLRKNYSVDWWKYDQCIFTSNATRAGRMKDVVAFQNALIAVRKAEPNLYIENCQSGGRMINELTTLLTQGQWIADGGTTGIEHARSNWSQALGALEFMPPSTIIRWMNRPDENDQADDEFTRMYCRSTMAGVSGISADLSKIVERQRNLLVSEIKNYRRLIRVKSSGLYDIYPPQNGSPAAGVVYVDSEKTHAAILLLRWDAKGEITFPVSLKLLDSAKKYHVEYSDRESPSVVDGTKLSAEGLGMKFAPNQDSVLVFLDAGS